MCASSDGVAKLETTNVRKHQLQPGACSTQLRIICITFASVARCTIVPRNISVTCFQENTMHAAISQLQPPMQVKTPAGRRKCLFEGWVGKAGTLAAPVWQNFVVFFRKPVRPCDVATMTSPCTGWRRQGRRNSLRLLLTRAQHASTPLERTELHIWATHWGTGNLPPSLLEQLQDPGATSPFLFLSASCQPFVLMKQPSCGLVHVGACFATTWCCVA